MVVHHASGWVKTQWSSGRTELTAMDSPIHHFSGTATHLC